MPLRYILSFIITMLVGSACLQARPLPDNDSYNVTRAVEEFDNGNIDKALEFISREIVDHPDNGKAYLLKAEFLSINHEYGEALSNISTALKKLPKKDKENRAIAYGTEGKIYLILGDTVKAIDNYKAAVKILPDDYGMLKDLATTLTEAREFDESDQICRRMISLDPTQRDAYLGLARNAVLSEDYEEAARRMDTLIEKFGGNTYDYSYRADVYKELGRYDEALDDIITALTLYYPNSWAQTELFEFPVEYTPVIISRLEEQILIANPFHIPGWYYILAQVCYDNYMYTEGIEAIKKIIDWENDPTLHHIYS